MVDTRVRSVAGILAVGLLLLVVGVTIAVFSVPIPKGSETIVGQLIGTLLTLLGACVTFYYGSSESSRLKDQTINTQADTTKSAQAALPVADTAPTIPVEPGEKVVVEGKPGD